MIYFLPGDACKMQTFSCNHLNLLICSTDYESAALPTELRRPMHETPCIMGVYGSSSGFSKLPKMGQNYPFCICFAPTMHARKK